MTLVTLFSPESARGVSWRFVLDVSYPKRHTWGVMATLRQTTFRLTAEDLALLAALQAKTGVLSRSDVIRMAIRELANAHGITAYVVQPVISTSTRRELALIALCDVCNRPGSQAEIDAAQAELDAAREADEAFKAAKKAVSK